MTKRSKNSQIDNAGRYTTVCTSSRPIWQKRLDNDYYDIDLEDSPALTSPHARRIASFIEDLYGQSEIKFPAANGGLETRTRRGTVNSLGKEQLC